jgi:hypothetical protein
MKLTQFALALSVLLLAGVSYVLWEANGVQKQNADTMAKLTQYVEAVTQQIQAQDKLQKDSGVPGLVSPMTFDANAATTVANMTSLPEAKAPATAEPLPPSIGTAGSAPVVVTAPPPVETAQMRLVRGANSIGKVKEVVLDNGFLIVDAGTKNQVAIGQKFQIRRDAAVIGAVEITMAEDSEAIANINLKTIPTGVSIRPGDDLILPVNQP